MVARRPLSVPCTALALLAAAASTTPASPAAAAGTAAAALSSIDGTRRSDTKSSFDICPPPKFCSPDGRGKKPCTARYLQSLATARRRMQHAQKMHAERRKQEGGPGPGEEARIAHDVQLSRLVFEEAATGCALLLRREADGNVMGKEDADFVDRALQRAEGGSGSDADERDEGDDALCPAPETCKFSVTGEEGTCTLPHFDRLQLARKALEESSSGDVSPAKRLERAESYAELAAVACVLVMQRRARAGKYGDVSAAQQCQAPTPNFLGPF